MLNKRKKLNNHNWEVNGDRVLILCILCYYSVYVILDVAIFFFFFLFFFFSLATRWNWNKQSNDDIGMTKKDCCKKGKKRDLPPHFFFFFFLSMDSLFMQMYIDA